jgi:hypothetical protein
MRIHDNELLLTYQEAAQWCGVSEAYIATAVSKGVKCWSQVQLDGMRWLRYNAMKPKYQAMVLRATGGDPYKQAKDEATIAALEERSWQQKSLPELVESTIDNKDYEHFRKLVTRTEALELARGCAWLRLLAGVRGRNDAMKLGFGSKEELVVAALPLIAEAGLKCLRVTHYKALYHRLTDWNKRGRESMVHGNLGKQNALKLTEESKRYLIALMADPHKPHYPMVSYLYNKQARLKGWKEITAMTAQNYLDQPSVKPLWWGARHGAEQFYQKYDPTIRREGASAPDVLWLMDGTPLDLYFQKRKEKWDEKAQQWKTVTSRHERAYLFLCIDAYSWKFVATKLGTSEDAKIVRDTIKLAVQGNMRLPRQLQSDRSASIVAQEFLIKQLELHNTQSRPYSPKSKVIEAVIGHFQDMVLRYFDNFAGLNITAKRLDSRPNPDFLNEQRNDLPDWEELQRQFADAVTIWNNLATKERKSPNSLYSKESGGTEVGILSFLDMFWEKRNREYKYHQDGIHLEVDGVEHLYSADEPKLYRRLILDKFEVAFDRDCLDYIYLYQEGKPVMWEGGPLMLRSTELTKMALHDQVEGDRTRVNKLLRMKDGFKASIEEEYEEIGAEMAVKLGARYVYKEQLNGAEMAVKSELNSAPATTVERRKSWEEQLEEEYLED